MNFAQSVLFAGPELTDQYETFDIPISGAGLKVRHQRSFEALEKMFLAEDMARYGVVAINEPFRDGRVSLREYNEFLIIEYFCQLVRKYYPRGQISLVLLRESVTGGIVYYPTLRVAGLMDAVFSKEENRLSESVSARVTDYVASRILGRTAEGTSRRPGKGKSLTTPIFRGDEE